MALLCKKKIRSFLNIQNAADQFILSKTYF